LEGRGRAVCLRARREGCASERAWPGVCLAAGNGQQAGGTSRARSADGAFRCAAACPLQAEPLQTADRTLRSPFPAPTLLGPPLPLHLEPAGSRKPNDPESRAIRPFHLGVHACRQSFCRVLLLKGCGKASTVLAGAAAAKGGSTGRFNKTGPTSEGTAPASAVGPPSL
jgi:hypothetical protein